MSIRTTTLSFLLTMILTASNSSVAAPPIAPATAEADAKKPDGKTSWVASDNGMLELRLTVISRSLKKGENIQVTAELRNTSQQKLTVLRPFGDGYAAKAAGMKIWDAKQQVRYTGPTLTYVVGANAFAVIGPGEVVEDKLELTIDNFSGLEPPGAYALRYDYSYDGHWDTTAAAGNSGITGAWRGTISSREIPIVRN